MANKLLIVIPDLIPTVEIIVRTLKHLSPQYQIRIVLASQIKIKDLLSGEYKLLFIRICDPSFRSILNSMKKFKVKYFYYLDDNFWEIGKGTSSLAECYSNPMLVKTLNNFVKNAYSVIAGSENLKKYIQTYNPKVVAMKAAFDFDLIKDLERPTTSKIIKILYSGSLHREQDFAVVIPALKRILNEYPEEVELHFNGFVPKELKNFINVRYDENFYAYDSFIKKQFQTGYNIGIAPINDCPSSRAKSNLKYREYGACHIAGIYSNIPPYSDCITQFENGRLVEHNELSWYKALKELIDDKILREKIAENAFKDLRLNYTHAKIALAWENELNTLPNSSTRKSIAWAHCFLVKLSQKTFSLRYKIKRTGDFYKSHGFLYTCSKIVRNVWLMLYYKIMFQKKEKSLLNQSSP